MSEQIARTSPEVAGSGTHRLARRFAVMAALLVLVILARVTWHFLAGSTAVVSTEDAFLRADVTPLSAKVEGYVKAVPVSDNQRVAQGDLLLQIGEDDYAAMAEQSAANVEAAEAAIASIQTQKLLQATLIAQAEANLAANQADATRYQLEARRQRTLLQSSVAGTRQAVEVADANALKSDATLALNHAQIEQQRTQMVLFDNQERQARATLRAQRAALRLAQINLGYTSIRAPVAGMVGERTVKPGQFVRNGTQVISLVPSDAIWVVANFKETQLASVRVGDRATVIVDTFPDTPIDGRVESFSPASGAQFALLPPDNATGNFTKVTQRVPVKLTIAVPPALRPHLRPGMSVTARVDTTGR
jgi:membrane fusion protein (multidrug efflux system)